MSAIIRPRNVQQDIDTMRMERRIGVSLDALVQANIILTVDRYATMDGRDGLQSEPEVRDFARELTETLEAILPELLHNVAQDFARRTLGGAVRVNTQFDPQDRASREVRIRFERALESVNNPRPVRIGIDIGLGPDMGVSVSRAELEQRIRAVAQANAPQPVPTTVRILDIDPISPKRRGRQLNIGD